MAVNRTHALNVLARWRLRIKHGVMQETPVYEALRRYPPPPPPVNRKLEEIVLPTDDLETKYRAREAAAPISPLAPAVAPERDPAAYLAAKQYDYLREGGVSEEEALERANAEVAAERAAAVEAAQVLTAAVKAWRAGQSPCPEAVPLEEWAALRARLEQRPWSEWPTEARNEVDSWIAVRVLELSWRLERTFDEEAAVAITDGPDGCELADAIWRLRGELLGVDVPVDDANPEAYFLDADADLSDPEFDELQARAERRPLSAWLPDEVAQLDAYVRKKVKEDRTIAIVDPEAGERIDPDLPVERLRLELFPELCTNHSGIETDAPAISTFAVAGPSGTTDSSAFDPDSQSVLHVRATDEPAKIARVLARHGIYAKMDVNDLLDDVLRQTPNDDEETKHFVAALRRDRAPGSYAHRRLQHATKAVRLQRFIDRLYDAHPDRVPRLTSLVDADAPTDHPNDDDEPPTGGRL